MARCSANDDLANYNQVLKDTIYAAPRSLSAAVLNTISVPQPIYLSDMYWQAPVRVMVMGQETLGVDRQLSDVDTTTANWFDDFYKSEKREFQKFDFGFCMNWKRNPFWVAFQEVADVFGIPDRRAMAWSNLSKVQLLKRVANSASIMKLRSADRMQIIRWQTALALAEIEYAKPDVLIMFTGRLSWAAKLLYGGDKKSDVLERPLEALPWTTREINAPGLSGVIATQTYHPAVWSTWRAKANHERSVMLRWARKMGQTALAI